uniref:C-type lectin domain-containing protein n=1 Tax=Poecilia mexicana TaxID=48701 RepID=A0A3B3Z424_9TELE
MSIYCILFNAGRPNFCVFKVKIGLMCWAVLHMLVLLTLCCQPSVENDVGVAASCPQHQRAFQGSCFELVGQQLPFHRAEDWCEERGGHLAYVKDKETQNFLERHLDPQKDMWLGLAQSGTPKPQFSVNEEGKQNSTSRCVINGFSEDSLTILRFYQIKLVWICNYHNSYITKQLIILHT